MYHLSQSRSLTLLSTFLRRTPLRSWSRYLREKTRMKLNSYCKMATMTTTMRMKKKKKKKATRLKAEMMKTTLL
jgi:hypothetical protein